VSSLISFFFFLSFFVDSFLSGFFSLACFRFEPSGDFSYFREGRGRPGSPFSRGLGSTAPLSKMTPCRYFHFIRFFFSFFGASSPGLILCPVLVSAFRPACLRVWSIPDEHRIFRAVGPDFLPVSLFVVVACLRFCRLSCGKVRGNKKKAPFLDGPPWLGGPLVLPTSARKVFFFGTRAYQFMLHDFWCFCIHSFLLTVKARLKGGLPPYFFPPHFILSFFFLVLFLVLFLFFFFFSLSVR